MSIKTLNDYKKAAENRGYIYILETIPQNIETRAINAWTCDEEKIDDPEHVWSTTYKEITREKDPSKCPGCNPRVYNKRKSLVDYQTLATQKGYEYIGTIIPKNAKVPINAWMCQNNHLSEFNYNNLQQGQFQNCSKCR